MLGQNWVDIAFFGDSNTMYNSTGWTNGFGHKLYQVDRIKAFASNIFPGASTTAASHASNYGTGPSSSLGVDGAVARTSLQAGNNGAYPWMLLGSANGPAFANNLWTSGTGLRPASGFNDYVYISSTAADQNMHDYHIKLEGSNNAFDSTSAFIHRVGYLTFAAGGGHFRQSCTKIDHDPFANGVGNSSRVFCQTFKDGYSVATATVNADPTRTNTTLYFKKFGFNEFQTDSRYDVVGQVGFLFESIAVPNRPSYAINCISYASGDTIQTISNSCSVAKNALKIYFREMYERQVVCGGPGRVVVFLNGGVNDWSANNQISFKSHLDNAFRFVENCKKAWTEEGLPPNMLSFMIMPSHQHLSTDALAAFRKTLANSVQNSPDISAIDTVEMGVNHSYLSSNSFYYNGGADPVHLTENGYRNVSALIIQELSKYAESKPMANTVTSLNPLSTAAAFAPNFRGEAENMWQTPVLAASGTVTLPKIETFPAVFSITSEADNEANSRGGIICALTASKIIILAGKLVATAAAANTIVPTISSGVITLTANASFANPGSAQPVNVIRLT